MKYKLVTTNYDLEDIDKDNHRPGMPLGGYIVRYGVGVTGGRKYMLTFDRYAEANAFCLGIDKGIEMSKNNEVR